ncbi:MAG: ABC transporter ATP-binding protein [Leptolyngbyaceae cyanobacterium SM1_1_3]|nr:ABC transporter ATP-binding protein [Leptolyngbyaceae cyanobacterium SM1_1_3]NJN02110.1 ABC transporter ATP-binding protein [Leptolyngbyaceae cyanobacterium RM1_1_2]
MQNQASELAISTLASTEVKPSSTSALRIVDLCYAYADCPAVLQSVTFNIASGESVGLIGPNGAGKTTLFLSICGVLTPQKGEIALFEQRVQPGKFRPEIGLVFQNPSDQLFSLSVEEDVAFGPVNMGFSHEAVEERVREALQLTGVASLRHRPPHHLSGGERRMVAIASVLAMQPQMVIYDEPSANLDVRSRRRLIRFLQEASQTTLVSSHDLELVLEVCDRVILLDQGHIIADGIASEIMADNALMEAHGLERPHSLSHSQ